MYKLYEKVMKVTSKAPVMCKVIEASVSNFCLLLVVYYDSVP